MHGEARTSGASRGEQPTGDLARLLEAEARFADLLEASLRDRDAAIVQAGAAAEAERQAFLAGQADELARLDAHIAAEMRWRVERLEAETRATMACWSRLGHEELEALADRIAGRLLDVERAP